MKKWWILIFLLLLYSCALQPPPVCKKNGTSYCLADGSFTGQWYDYYERALSCMEGECYQSALSELNIALKQRTEDKRMARTFGMHFTDYFPHREKGLIHYLEGDYNTAKSELELSVKQYPSAKALFYLDKVRKAIMEQEKQIVSAPSLVVEFPSGKPDTLNQLWTRDDPVAVSGTAEDRQFVSEIFLNNKPVYIEASDQHVEFTKYLTLDQGRHEIDVRARNLLGGKTEHRAIINVDRSGPVIILKKIDPGVAVQGWLSDESGEIFLFINGTKVEIPKGKNVQFNAPVKPGMETVTLLAEDRLGNRTQAVIQNLQDVNLLALNSLNTATDAGETFTARGVPVPEIELDEWQDQDTAFKETTQIEGQVKSESNITALTINNTPVLYQQGGKIISFNHFIRLDKGKNRVIIKAENESGRSVKEISITRKTSRVFQQDCRYGFDMHPFTGKEQSRNRALLQYFFLENLIGRNRFQVAIQEELEKILDKNNFDLIPRNRSDKADSMLLGHIYETINGTEIAIRLVDADTSEILAVGDAYDESADRSTLMFMAAKLSAKLHMDIPMMDGSISSIVNGRIITKPKKWIPFKGKIRKNWPMIVYQEQNPEDLVRGSDTTVITNARMDRITGTGEASVMLIRTQNLEHGKTYRVITR